MYKKLINKYEEGEDVNKEGRKDKIIDNLVDKVLIMNIKVKTKMNKKGKKQIGISPISILRVSSNVHKSHAFIYAHMYTLAYNTYSYI